MVGESTEAVGAGVGGGSSGNKMPTLEEFGTNLTKMAEEVILWLSFCYSVYSSDYIALLFLSFFYIFSRANWILLLEGCRK